MEAPGARVVGIVGPVIENPVPVMVGCETERDALPESRIVSVWVLDTFTATEPKLIGLGTAEICGCMPTALTATVSVGSVALLVTATLPVAVPMEVGAKPTFTEACFPGPR